LLQGALQARSKVGLKMNVREDDLSKILNILPAMKQPTISKLVGSDWNAIETILDDTQVRDLIPALKTAGAQDIIEYPLSKVIP
jgi:ATP phosphoribosyltransferase